MCFWFKIEKNDKNKILINNKYSILVTGTQHLNFRYQINGIPLLFIFQFSGGF